MRTAEQIKDFLNAFTRWASTQPDIRAVALVGSCARGTASESSDIDLALPLLVVLTGLAHDIQRQNDFPL